MLVLSRKPGEKIILRGRGVEIELTAIRVGPNSVRLGIEAPVDIVVLREELEDLTHHQPTPAEAATA